MRVLAAIVTHNRRDLLTRCLDALDAQTRPPDAVLVIDNASTDGTVEMLAARGTWRIGQDNLGSAGGWHRAIAETLAHGYDAVWLMDDDGRPDPAALAVLAGALTPDMACISSVVLREDAPDRFVFPFPALDGAGHPALLAWPRKLATLPELEARATGRTYAFAHLFNGALVPRRTIEAIGNVEPAFFMFGDEVDYFYRMRRVGPVLSHLDAHHYHPDVTGRPLTEAKLYYYLKNTLVLNHRYMNRPALRDAATVGIGLLRYARRNGWRAAAAVMRGRRAVARQAIARGLKGQVGQDHGR